MRNVEAQHLFSVKITCFSYFFLRKTRGNTILEKITLKPWLPGVRLDTPLGDIVFLIFSENLIKIEDAGVATTLKIDFSNIQGQLTPQSRVESGSNSNSSKTLWLSLFLSRMKKIRSKLKALEWPQYKILIFQTLKGS